MTCGVIAISPVVAEESKQTHTLFMGAELTIMAKDGALPVCDVQNNSFVVKGPAGRVVVSANDDQFKLKIVEALKLTPIHLTLAQLKLDRSYSLGNDPMAKFQDAARTSAYMASGVNSSDAAIRDAEAGLGVAQGGLAALGPDALPEAKAPWIAQVNASEARLSQTEAASQAAQSMDRMEAFSSVSNSVKMSNEIGAEQFDALTVSFELSTPRPLDQPYLVITMRYFAEKDRRDTARTWVYAERLPVLDEHPRKFVIRRAGFPPGYHIDTYQVHVYDGVQELATTVSRKQVALTTEEAFTYAVIQYIGDNRDQTKSPVKAKAFWPTDLHNRLVPEKLSRAIYVKVGKDGHALGLFEDADGAKPVTDTEILALAPDLCFLPALQKGKPVVSIAPLKLSTLN